MPQPLVNPRTPLPMSAPRATTPRTARSALPTVFCIFCPFRVKLFHRRIPRPNGYMVPGCTPATYHRSTRDPDWGRVQMPRLLAAIAHPRVQTQVSPSVASPSLAAPGHATKHRAFCALAPPTAKDTRSRRCSFSVGCWSQLGTGPARRECQSTARRALASCEMELPSVPQPAASGLRHPVVTADYNNRTGRMRGALLAH
jgi:hypothetical protein